MPWRRVSSPAWKERSRNSSTKRRCEAKGDRARLETISVVVQSNKDSLVHLKRDKFAKRLGRERRSLHARCSKQTHPLPTVSWPANYIDDSSSSQIAPQCAAGSVKALANSGRWMPHPTPSCQATTPNALRSRRHSPDPIRQRVAGTVVRTLQQPKETPRTGHDTQTSVEPGTSCQT